jgi:hypothetical protein
MPLLPPHLDRALHAACGAAADDSDDPIPRDEILERLGDPPRPAELERWLGDLVGLGLLAPDGDGWLVTDAGWRAVNLLPPDD